MVAGESARSTNGEEPWIFLSIVDEFLESFERTGIENSQAQWRPLEKRYRGNLVCLIPHFLLQGLQNDMGDVETGHEITIGLCSNQFSPAEGSPTAHFVVD